MDLIHFPDTWISTDDGYSTFNEFHSPESNIVLTHTLGGKKIVMKIRFKNKPIFQNKISSCSLPAYMTVFFFLNLQSHFLFQRFGNN